MGKSKYNCVRSPLSPFHTARRPLRHVFFCFVACSAYLLHITSIPWSHLKFLDEASFDPTCMCVRFLFASCDSTVGLFWLVVGTEMIFIVLRRAAGYAEKGRRLVVARDSFPVGETYSITILTTLHTPTGFFISQPRTQSNNAYDFLLFICELLRMGYLVAGDVLVLDNAPIHYSNAIAPAIDALMTAFGCRLLFLPAYSPELNPCELVFAHIKRWLRLNRTEHHIVSDLALACASITRLNVAAYYRKCIYDFQQ